MLTSPPILAGSDEATLLDLIEKRTGIVLQTHQIEHFRQVVAEGCRLLGSDVAGYIAALADGGNDHPVYRHLIDQITVNETYFFRDDAQIGFLKDTWLPGLLERRTAQGRRSIRVWSAASSSGEEIYTIAMLLADLLGGRPGWHVRLIGSDIDDGALAKAKRGIYTGWSFRATPDDMRARHFTPQDDGFAVAPSLASMVEFQHLNLATDLFPSAARDLWNFDLILCRNVFIYFSKPVVRRVLAKLSASLATDGIMMVGASDVVDSEVADLAIRHQGNAFYFVHAKSVFEPEAKPPVRTAPPPVPPRRPAVRPPSRPQAPPAPHKISVVEPERHSALAAAGRGDLAGAERDIVRLLAQTPDDAGLHLGLGTILAEKGDFKRGEEHLRKALYLDRKLVDAHVHLAHLLLATGRVDMARKSLENGLAMARQHPPHLPVPGHEAMTYGQMAETLKAEIGGIDGGGLRRRQEAR